MSYESEVLADTPIVYYRLDQGGLGVNGESVPDLSGNGLDATLSHTGTDPTWGHVSPIETDAASREYWGFTNPGIYGFTGDSTLSRASDALMAPSPKDFTLEEWLRPMDDLPLAGDFQMACLQGTGGALLTFSGGSRIGGFCFDTNATLYKVIDPTGVFTANLGVSRHVVVVRSGDALALYLDGGLVAFTTVTSGLPTLFSGSPFRVHTPTGFYTNARHDEVAYYNYALGADRILAHYEAALNDANARGQCDIRTTAIIIGRDEPDPIQYPFRHNWDKPVIERLRWRSSNFKPTNGSTELRKQRSAPRRQVEYQHLLYDEQLRRRFEARSFGGRTSQVQFEPDKVQVESLLTGATSASGDFTYRDFQVDQMVLIYQSDDLYEYQTLTSVSDTLIEWESGLSRDYVGAWLKPCREGRLNLSQSAELQTDTVADASSQYDLLEVDEPLEPRRIIPFTPTTTYRSRELWDIREWQGHDYSDLPTLEWTSDRTEVDSGVGSATTKTYRWGADMLQPWNNWYKGRAQIAKLLGWLYERAGQSNPFWMPTFRQDLRPVSRSGNVLTVAGHEYTNLYAPADTRADLAFVYWDGTVTGVQVLSSGVDGVNDSLELSATVPTFTNLRYLSFLRRVILSSDEVELAWETDDVLKVAFAVIDAPLDFALGSPSVSPSPSASGSFSPSPSHSASATPSPSGSQSPSGSVSPSTSGSPSVSPSLSQSPSGSVSPSGSTSPTPSPSGSVSPSLSVSPSGSSSSSPSASPSITPSSSPSPSVSPSGSTSPSASQSPSISVSPSTSPSSSASPSGFNPSQLASIWEWWEPRLEGLNDNDGIATLNGQANNRDFTQGVAAPTYKTGILNGEGIARFTSLSTYLQGPNPSALTACHIFIVVQLVNDPATTGSGGFWIVGSDVTVNGAEAIPFTDGNVYSGAGSDTRKSTGNPTPSLSSQFRVLEFISTSSEWTMLIDGVQHFTTGTNTPGFTSTMVLGQSLGGTIHMLGDVAGFYFCSAKLSVGDRTDLINYINAEFGLSSL